MPIITGNSIILREYMPEDINNIMSWVNNPEITNTLGNSFIYPKTRLGIEKFLNSVMENNSEIKGFVISDKKTLEYIGQIDLFRFDWINRLVAMQIVIGNKTFQNNGYGSEAIMLLIDFCFNTLNLNRIELELYSYNIAAHKCYLKCGFKEEGILRDKVYRNGQYWNSILMSIIKSEYSPT